MSETSPSPPTPAPNAHRGPRQRLMMHTASFVSTTLLALGILAALRTGLSETETFTIFRVSPSVAVLWLAIGLAGVAASQSPRSARLGLLICGPLLVALGLGALVGSANGGLLIADAPIAVLHLALGAACVAVGLLPIGATAAPADAPPASADSPHEAPDDTPMAPASSEDRP